MKSKTFKVGEYGLAHKYKVTCNKNKVTIYSIDFHNVTTDSYSFDQNDISAIDNYMCEQATSYHASLVTSFIKSL